MSLFKRKPTYHPPTLTELSEPILGSVRYGGVDGPASSPGPNSGVLSATSTPKTIAANAERMGLQVVSDAAGSGTVYLLLGSVAQRGVVSASNWDLSMAPGGKWEGQISQSVWSGPVQVISTATINVGVVEV